MYGQAYLYVQSQKHSLYIELCIFLNRCEILGVIDLKSLLVFSKPSPNQTNWNIQQSLITYSVVSFEYRPCGHVTSGGLFAAIDPRQNKSDPVR